MLLHEYLLLLAAFVWFLLPPLFHHGDKVFSYHFIRYLIRIRHLCIRPATAAEVHTLQSHAQRVAQERAASGGGMMWDRHLRRWVPRRVA